MTWLENFLTFKEIMFLDKDFVLANELVQQMNINIANISKLSREFEERDWFGDIVKMNNCTFLKRTSQRFPKNIREGLASFDFTDLSYALPARWIQSEYGITERELEHSGILEEKTKIGKKEFYIFVKDFVEKVRGMIACTLNKMDRDECILSGDIDGSLMMSKNKFLSWYSLT